MKVRSALVLLAVCCAGSAASDFDPTAYPAYETCALCHGLFGNSQRHKFPKLAGQRPEYLAAQIRAFQTGNRTNDHGQMVNIVAQLTEEEISVVVDWFSTQDPPQPVDLSTGNRGEEIVTRLGCNTCHGRSEMSNVPYLTAQHSAYLNKQMLDYRDGYREEPAIAKIHRNLLSISEFEINEIADYFASQKRQNDRGQ